MIGGHPLNLEGFTAPLCLLGLELGDQLEAGDPDAALGALDLGADALAADGPRAHG
jgi:hypothetical protein